MVENIYTRYFFLQGSLEGKIIPLYFKLVSYLSHLKSHKLPVPLSLL